MTKEFRLYFEELTPEAQRTLLEFYGVEKPTEMNWDSIPITTFEVEEKEN